MFELRRISVTEIRPSKRASWKPVAAIGTSGSIRFAKFKRRAWNWREDVEKGCRGWRWRLLGGVTVDRWKPLDPRPCTRISMLRRARGIEFSVKRIFLLEKRSNAVSVCEKTYCVLCASSVRDVSSWKVTMLRILGSQVHIKWMKMARPWLNLQITQHEWSYWYINARIIYVAKNNSG